MSASAEAALVVQNPEIAAAAAADAARFRAEHPLDIATGLKIAALLKAAK